MKNKIVLIVAIATLGLFAACAGSSDKAPDTAAGTGYNQPKSIDTTITTTTTGSAGVVDNSGSGGTNIDTPKKSTPAP
jgi:hypothetical protein